MADLTLLEHIKNTTDLSPADEALLDSLIINKHYKKGALISEQGEVTKLNTYIISGCTKTFHTDTDGNSHMVAFGVEGWWAADLASFLSNSPADYSVQCLEDSQVVHLTKDAFETLLDQSEFFERFFRILVQNAYVSSQKRIVRNFSLSAKERYKLFQLKYPQIEQRVPQYLVASYLGITKEFLSKLRKEMAYEK